MKTEIKLSWFAKYAWFTLVYNLVVILWGVFLRASFSGDGCGEHWVTCGGEFIPSAPEMKTFIEFFHRVTTSIAGLIVIGLAAWAGYRRFYGNDENKKLIFRLSLACLFFIIVEGIIGGLLVLTGNTAANWTPQRPFWMAGHLVNTFTLLALIALTAWFASGGRRFSLKMSGSTALLLSIAVIGIFVVGISGSMAALSSMIFPSSSLAEGIAKDFSATSHYILRIRPFHPLISILLGVYLMFLAGWFRKASGNDAGVIKWGNVMTGLIFTQFISGGVMVVLHVMGTPIIMQLIHLLLADGVWISFVLMAASFLSSQTQEQTLKAEVFQRA